MVEPFRRTVIDGETSHVPLHVLPGLLGRKRDVGRVDEESLAGRVSEEREGVPGTAEVESGIQIGIACRDADLRVHGHGLARLERKGGPARESLGHVARDDPLVDIVVGRYEVLDVVRSARDTEAVPLKVAGPEHGAAAFLRHVEHVQAEGLTRDGVRAPDQAHLVVRVAQPARALADAHGEARAAGAPLLRNDLNHAGRRLGAIQGRRGRPLDDLDALDVGGIDVVESGETGPDPARRYVVVHADAVDVEQWVPAELHAAPPPDQNPASAAGVPLTGADNHAGNAGVQEFAGGRDGCRLDERGGFDGPQGIPERPPAHASRCARHHDLVETDRRVRHRDSQVRRAALCLDQLGPDADSAHTQGERAGRHAGESEAACRVGENAQIRTIDGYLNVGDGNALIVYHDPRDDLLLTREGRGGRQKQEHRGRYSEDEPHGASIVSATEENRTPTACR